MAAETKGILKGKVSSRMVFEFIRDNYDNLAKIDTKEIDEESGEIWEIGQIYFLVDNCERMLTYYYSNEIDQEADHTGTDNKLNTHIRLGCNQQAIEIISDIVNNFGGWIDKNDADDICFEEVK